MIAARAVAQAQGPTGPVDTQAPSVSFSTPASGATVSGTVTVQIAASDNVGVTSVTLTVDGVSKASWTGAPYTYAWNTSALANGTHTLVATAKDAAGNTATSTIQVTISSAPPLSQGWYNTGWSNRKKITIDHGKVSGGADLTNYPMLVSVTDA